MRDLITRSRSMEETAQSKKGMLWILEILVFFVATFAEMIIVFPPQFIATVTNKEYLEAATTGDMAKTYAASMETMQALMASDWYAVLLLVATIMMTLVVLLFCKLIQKRKMRTLGFIRKDMFKEYGIGLLVGFVMFSVCVVLGILTGEFLWH